MFATPRNTSANSARRSLELSGASTNPTRNLGQDEESPVAQSNTGTGDGDGDVATLLRSIQQQVSAIQAKQNQVASERSERTFTASTPSSNHSNSRKLPRELSVSVATECSVCMRYYNLM